MPPCLGRVRIVRTAQAGQEDALIAVASAPRGSESGRRLSVADYVRGPGPPER